MIISPPFLPSAQANESDADYVKRAMTGDASGNGAYPVSNGLGWHGGLHLEAPAEAGARLPVRAIADGTIKYVRQPKAMPASFDENTQDPLYYHSGWTDNGVVVIEHKTDIGEGAGAANIVFYSIYLHLHSIAQPLPAAGRPVWRKDEIGQAGYIYGQPNWIHFEIICDEANLKKLINRDTGTLDTSKDGRTDSVWGEIYVKLPAGAEVKATDPQAITHTSHGTPVPTTAAAPAAPTTEDYFIGIRYERGHCITTTYKKDGTIVGMAIDDASYEYTLYDTATHRFGACPSAGYELLRFGRVLGLDALAPADAPHWRKINTAQGTGFVNLNALNTKKFSDADFPEWKNWKLIEDDAEPNDSRCDSPTIRSLLNPTAPAAQGATSLRAAVTASAAATAKLHRTICKFPSEWDKSTIASRWDWLKDQAKATDAGLSPMSEADFTQLTQHVEALCFWSEAGLTAIPTPWHFEPREFISAFRQCDWLSKDELKRVLNFAPAQGQSRAETLRIELNKVVRKYLNAPRLRLGHFFAQIGHETGWWQFREELGNERYFRTMYEIITVEEAKEDYDSGLARRLGSVKKGETEAAYSIRRPEAVAAKAKGLDNGQANAAAGGQSGDGPRFKGRGFLQITGRKNYTGYGRYRNKDFTTDPNPLLLATDNYNACDASGFYWSRERANIEADKGSGPQTVSRVGGIVNRGSASKIPLHNVERQNAFIKIWKYLNDNS